MHNSQCISLLASITVNIVQNLVLHKIFFFRPNDFRFLQYVSPGWQNFRGSQTPSVIISQQKDPYVCSHSSKQSVVTSKRHPQVSIFEKPLHRFFLFLLGQFFSLHGENEYDKERITILASNLTVASGHKTRNVIEKPVIQLSIEVFCNFMNLFRQVCWVQLELVSLVRKETCLRLEIFSGKYGHFAGKFFTQLIRDIYDLWPVYNPRE